MTTPPEECIDALLEAADRLGESPTKARYEELGLVPASATIIRTMGGWNAAKEAAGLETNPSSGSRVQPKPDDVEVSVETAWEDLSVDQRWYYRNREADNRYELRRRARLRVWIHDYKADSDGCARCDEDDPACLAFHHVDGADKEMAVNKMVPYGYSREDIRAEMERCVLLCANCHRKEHDGVSDGGGSSSGSTSALERSSGRRSSREELRRWSYEYRRADGCQECGESDPRCLQFHHLDPAEKEGSVGNMISNGCSAQALLAEVEKCEVLCVNCHRKEHYTDPAERFQQG